MRATPADDHLVTTPLWRCIRCGSEVAQPAAGLTDRRDPARRIATVNLVVRCLCGDEACSTELLCRALDGAPPAAAERVLRWLAFKGLARSVGDGRWIATSPLRAPAALMVDAGATDA
jgi:hypothetical protein